MGHPVHFIIIATKIHFNVKNQAVVTHLDNQFGTVNSVVHSQVLAALLLYNLDDQSSQTSWAQLLAFLEQAIIIKYIKLKLIIIKYAAYLQLMEA